MVTTKISKIEIGDYEVDTWYSSAYPNEYVNLDKIYLCEFCLTYMYSSKALAKHNAKCIHFCPPADEIYRSEHDIEGIGLVELSVYEADGRKNKLYCQNLCLLSKLFLEHKTLLYDVEHFLFYVLTWNDNVGSRIIGYFSKEKHCIRKNNLCCIVVLPQYRKFGYGRFLIEFSYLLTKEEKTLGGPERPLSELGLISYNNYWKHAVLKVIGNKSDISIRELSNETAMTISDILDALYNLNMIRRNISGTYTLCLLNKDLEVNSKKQKLTVNYEGLRWTKYISLYSSFEESQPQ